MGYLDTTEVKEKLETMRNIIERLQWSIENSKTDRGAVILGDQLEKDVSDFLDTK